MDALAVMLVNISSIAGFTFLAYYFNHGWIVLFALLFLFTKRENK